MLPSNPFRKQVSAISITQGSVTKSVSTRRCSEGLVSLIESIQAFVPEKFRRKPEGKTG